MHDRRRASAIALLALLWAVLLVMVIKMTVGLQSASLSLVAASFHSLVCGVSALVSLLLLRRSAGHGRLETLTVLVLWSVLGFGAVSIGGLVLRSWTIAGSIRLPNLSPLLFQTLAILTVISLCLAMFGRPLALSLRQPLLRITANFILQDAWISALVWVSLLLVGQGYGWLDGALALVILAVIFLSAWRLILQQLPMLAQPQAIAPEAIAQVVHQVDGVLRCGSIRSRGLVGRQIWVELQVALHPDFREIEDVITDQIEAALRRRYGATQTIIQVIEPKPQAIQDPPIETSERSYDWN
jgi:divalent metal cation (Fe/Co/Zn/Cd) transporter